MPRFLQTMLGMVYHYQDRSHPEWKRGDYVALVIIALTLAAVMALWP